KTLGKRRLSRSYDSRTWGLTPVNLRAIAQPRSPIGRIASVTLCATASTACVRQLPPAATPDAIAPAVAATTPVASGNGRLVVDVVESPTPVQRVWMQADPVNSGPGTTTYRFREQTSLLCPSTPCVTDVPTGNVLLGFPVVGDPDTIETELVHI